MTDLDAELQSLPYAALLQEHRRAVFLAPLQPTRLTAVEACFRDTWGLHPPGELPDPRGQDQPE